MSMKVAIQPPAALWTYFIFDTLQQFATKACHSTRFEVDLVECSGLWEELSLWRNLTSYVYW